MGQCPSCGASIKEDYEMISCDGCGAILFVDMDGNAHRSVDEPEPAAPEPPPIIASPQAENSFLPDPVHSSHVPVQNETSDAGYASMEPLGDLTGDSNHEAYESGMEAMPDSIAPMFANDAAIDPYGQPMSQEIEDVQMSAPQAQPPQPQLEEIIVAEEPAFDMDEMLGYGGQGSDDTSRDGAAGSAQGPAGDPLGLSGYTNSELSLGKDGMLLFSILIRGIDSKEIRDSIREVLSDGRFAWDVDRIMASISMGTMKIESVPPVKASILVNQLKRLPIWIRWEQYAITQMDGSSEE